MGVSACHARRSLCKSVDAGDGALVRRVARVLSCSVGSTTSKDLPSHAQTQTHRHTDIQAHTNTNTNTKNTKKKNNNKNNNRAVVRCAPTAADHSASVASPSAWPPLGCGVSQRWRAQYR